MKKLLTRGLLGLAAVTIPVGAALAMSPAAFASTTHSSTTNTGSVNSTGYIGTLVHTNTTNSQWSIDNYSLHVVGEYGWTNDFVLNVQTPQSGNHSNPIVNGSVTDTTEYGSSIQNFSVDATAYQAAAEQISFSIASDGHIVVSSTGQSSDPAYVAWDPVAHAIFQAQAQMVYHTAGAQNAGYWFGNVVAGQ